MRADELALIVNANEPAGAELAAFYAAQRHVPDHRILTLDLPKGDELTPKQYAEQVVPQVRAFLKAGNLEGQVKCLVPVYGVPLRIAARHNTPSEAGEIRFLLAELSGLSPQIRPTVEAVERQARRLDPTFAAQGNGLTLAELDRRWAAAVTAVSAQLPTIPDEARRTTVARDFFAAAVPLLGTAAEIRVRQLDLSLHPERKDADGPPLRAAEQAYLATKAEAAGTEDSPEDATSRDRLRKIVRGQFGLLQYARLLADQIDYLEERHGSAAFDSELSLVRWRVHPHNYPGGSPYAVSVQGGRGQPQWFPNPLFYRDAFGPRTSAVPTLMVTRLDGPSPELVKAMIATGVRTEQRGLKGRIVIDSLGYRPGAEPEGKQGYGTFDQTLRDLRDVLAGRPGLDVLFDDKPDVLPAGSASNVALYCGWYAVNAYVPSCTFAGGAIGMHVASYTMTTLRPTDGNPNWAAGLLSNGCVATVGPVAEPFLSAFPRPDDFFPLVLTGKLTLAECYWRTVPIAAWQMTCVGDPLYTPYKADPGLAVGDLPLRLRGLFKSPPTTAP